MTVGAPWSGSIAIGKAFEPRRNSLNAMRLVLATLVIVSHSWPVGGFGADPAVGSQDLGDWALAGFFVVSGFLITASAERLPLPRYLWHRFLRIYPAFLACLLVVAFVFAPFSTFFQGQYQLPSAVAYVLNNIGLVVRQWDIAGTLISTPIPGTWNGPLWTLIHEFACYIVIAVSFVFVRGRRARRLFVVCWLTATTIAAVVLPSFWRMSELVPQFANLGTFFAAGAVLYFYRDQVARSATLAAAAAVSFSLIVALSLPWVLAAIPLAYLAISVGCSPILRMVGAKNDISYGIYIYGFPVQQSIVVIAGAGGVPLWLFILLSIVLTVPLAWVSWLVVERPAMQLRSVTLRRAARPTVKDNVE